MSKAFLIKKCPDGTGVKDTDIVVIGQIKDHLRLFENDFKNGITVEKDEPGDLAVSFYQTEENPTGDLISYKVERQYSGWASFYEDNIFFSKETPGLILVDDDDPLVDILKKEAHD